MAFLPPVLFAAAPTVNDDATRYVPGQVWINTATRATYLLSDAAVGAAVWRLVLDGLTLLDDLTLPKTSGKGMRVDTAVPTFGWRDMLGRIQTRSAGANDPVFAVWNGSIRQYQFSNVVMNEVFQEHHVPHDYLPGSDVFVHNHWSQAAVDTGGPAGVPGTVKWSFDVTYAKAHNQAAFIVPVTTSVTQQASSTQYQQMLTEVQISTPGGGAGMFDTNQIEPDGLIILRVWRDPADAADTLNQPPFLHFCDIHYQSTNIATKQRAPNFYV